MAVEIDRSLARGRDLYAAGMELYEVAALVDAYVRNGRLPSDIEAASLTLAVQGYGDALHGPRPQAVQS